jgi:acetyl esterase/lipase
VDYRLAPEYPFPAAIEDVTKAYRWLIKSGTQPHQIIMGGDSSGGGLAMSTLLSLRDSGDPLPSAVILLSPWLDLALTGESLVSRAHLDPLVSQEGLRACAKHYIGDRDPKDPLISPLYADLHSLPPMLIHVGDHELLLSDAIRLADRAQAANVEVKLDVWPEMWHVWHAWAASLPEGQEALNQIGGYVRRYLPRVTATFAKVSSCTGD